MLYKGVLVSALQQCESAIGIHISLGISNFLEEISSLSHSVVFLYFFALKKTKKTKERSLVDNNNYCLSVVARTGLTS